MNPLLIIGGLGVAIVFFMMRSNQPSVTQSKDDQKATPETFESITSGIQASVNNTASAKTGSNYATFDLSHFRKETEAQRIYKFRRNPPLSAKVAMVWLLSVFREAEVAGIYKTELVQSASKSLLYESSVDFINAIKKGALEGAKSAGVIGAAIGAAISAIVQSILNAQREDKLQVQRRKLSEAFALLMSHYGPPPTALLVFAHNAKVYPPALLEAEQSFFYIARLIQEFAVRGYNLKAYDPVETGIWYSRGRVDTSKISLVNDGSWNLFKIPALDAIKAIKNKRGEVVNVLDYTFYSYQYGLHFDYLLSENWALGGKKPHYSWAFQRGVKDILSSKSEYDWFKFEKGDFKDALFYAGYSDSANPISLGFTIGADPTSERFVDLFDLTDIFSSFGGGSISLPPGIWRKNIQIETISDDFNWLLTK